MANRTLLRRCSASLSGVLIVTYIIHYIVTAGMNPYQMAKGTTFDDVESFVAYMEQDIERTYYSYENAIEIEPIETESIVYYDENGNVISEDEARKRTILDADGNVICEYIERNDMVSSTSYTVNGDVVGPFHVVTYDDLDAAKMAFQGMNHLFGIIYVLELIAVVMIYFYKRVR